MDDVCGVCGGKNIKLPGEMYEWNGPGGRLFDKLMQADSYYYGNGIYTLETVYDQHGECCSKFLSMPDVVHDPWFAPIYTGEGWHTQKTIFNLVGRIYDEANDICCEPEDMDCEGVCFGSATLDCHRTCNGNREWVLEFPDRLDKESIWKRHKNHVAHKGSAFLNEVFESIQEEVYDFSKQKMVQPYMHIANRTFVTKLLTAESQTNDKSKSISDKKDTLFRRVIENGFDGITTNPNYKLLALLIILLINLSLFFVVGNIGKNFLRNSGILS